MVTMALTTEESQMLANLIECCISDTRGEIIKADNWQYKLGLKKRKEMLVNLLERVQQLEQPVCES